MKIQWGFALNTQRSLQEELENGLIDQNPLILGYPATNPELESTMGDGNRHDLLEPIFIQALYRKCA